MELNEIVERAYVAVKGSDDFSDAESTECFRMLTDSILSHPSELLSLPNKRKCAFVLSCMAVSDYFSRFPYYNGKATGEIICSAGLYL